MQGSSSPFRVGGGGILSVLLFFGLKLMKQFYKIPGAPQKSFGL